MTSRRAATGIGIRLDVLTRRLTHLGFPFIRKCHRIVPQLSFISSLAHEGSPIDGHDASGRDCGRQCVAEECHSQSLSCFNGGSERRRPVGPKARLDIGHAPTTIPDRRQDRTLPQPLPTRPNCLSRSRPIGTSNLERTHGRHPHRSNPGRHRSTQHPKPERSEYSEQRPSESHIAGI